MNTEGTIIEDIKNWTGNINTLILPVIFKNKILFSEGTHNGVMYSQKEIENASKFNELGLFVDHIEGVETLVGTVRNPNFFTEDGKGVCRGDLVFFDSNIVRKILMGMHTGVSPRVSLDRNISQGAKNSQFQSFSLVLFPADQRTFLNSDNSKQNINNKLTMENNDVKTDVNIEEINKVKAELNEINKVKAELDALKKENEENKHVAMCDSVVNIEHELGLMNENLTQRKVELSKCNTDILNGMLNAYQFTQNFITTATTLENKQSSTYEFGKNNNEIKDDCETQMLKLCQNK